MAVGFAFVVTEYCTQSHLSTEDYEDAVRGLRRTRRFKKYTFLFRGIPEYLIEVAKRVCHKFFSRHVRGGRRSLMWTWKTRSSAIPIIVIEEPRLLRVGKGRSEDGSFLDDGDTEGGETGGETDDGESAGETDASADNPLRKIQRAPTQHIEMTRSALKTAVDTDDL